MNKQNYNLVSEIECTDCYNENLPLIQHRAKHILVDTPKRGWFTKLRNKLPKIPTWKELGFQVERPSNSDHPIMDRVDQCVFNTGFVLINGVCITILIGILCFLIPVTIVRDCVVFLCLLPYNVRRLIKHGISKPFAYHSLCFNRSSC